MKAAIWDTYARRADGKTMHFDIVVDGRLSDAEKVLEFGRLYLRSKPFKTKELRSHECSFCHIEQVSNETSIAIEKKGFSIIEMDNCT